MTVIPARQRGGLIPYARHFPVLSALLLEVQVYLFHFLSYWFEILRKGDEFTGNRKLNIEGDRAPPSCCLSPSLPFSWSPAPGHTHRSPAGAF